MRRKRRIRLERHFQRVNKLRCHLLKLKYFHGRTDLEAEIEKLQTWTGDVMDEIHPLDWSGLERLVLMSEKLRRSLERFRASQPFPFQG
jgi:hypothetical protein